MNEKVFESDSGRRGSKGVLVAISVVGIVCLFLFPIPRDLLDILLSLNLILSLTLLLRGLLLSEPTQLFAFPTLLLLTTLFRLGLNISSTRLILLGGQGGLDAAGKVIRAFGEFVVQGDFVVGAILFAVIALVNFLVITKGAARVAEVSARFSLDALPGKQLSIDADLRAGNITREEAERRRGNLMRESGFYGAMDGAMRFIQGDAIAGLIIVLINVIGGGIIGVTRDGMNVESALRNFGVLAIGDGLVSILPSLLISVCAGVVVTTVSRGAAFTVSSQVVQTVLSDRLALSLAGASAILFAFIPGLPFLPFVIIGTSILFFSLRPDLVNEILERLKNALGVRRNETLSRILEPTPFLPAASARSIPSILEAPDQNRIIEDHATVQLELSREALEDLGGATKIEQAYEQKRAELFELRGVTTLPLRLKLSAADGAIRHKVIRYRISLRSKFIKEGNCLSAQNFIGTSPLKIVSLGAEVRALGRDPITGVTGAWVENDENLGLALRKLELSWKEPSEYLALECVAPQLRSVRDLFGVDEVRLLLGQLAQSSPRLAEEFSSTHFLTAFEVSLLFKSLLHDRVSVRDSKLIFEGILEYAASEPLPEPGATRGDWLKGCTRSLRRKLSETIIDTISARGEPLRVFLLNPTLNEELQEVVEDWSDRGSSLPIDPTRAGEIRRTIGKMLQPAYERGQLPIVILCNPEVREAVDELLSQRGIFSQRTSDEVMTREWYRTVAFDEIESATRVETIGILPG